MQAAILQEKYADGTSQPRVSSYAVVFLFSLQQDPAYDITIRLPIEPVPKYCSWRGVKRKGTFKLARNPGKKNSGRRKPPNAGKRSKELTHLPVKPGDRPAMRGRSVPRHKPDVNIDRAQLAWDAHRFDEAIHYYELALKRDPTNAVLLVDVARAYGLRFRYADAERLVDRACDLHPNDAHLQLMLGRSYEMLKQFDRAIACYQRALKLEPASSEKPQTLFELAKMHERLHDLEAARRCAEESLALTPHRYRVSYLLAILERRTGNLEAAQDRLQQLIADGQASYGVVGDSWYQLAAMHDEAGRYHEAYEALTRAKRIFELASENARRDAVSISKTVTTTFNAITAEHFQRWRTRGEKFKPIGKGLALLTSHPRSGTTLLEQVVDSHNELISADELQILTQIVYVPLFRGKPKHTTPPEILDNVSDEDVAKVRRDYCVSMEGALRESIGDRILLDKNPAMTGLLPMIGRVFPEMKILFALRDPRDVVISCFMQRLPINPVSIHYLTLEGTVNEYAATMRNWLKVRGMLKNPWLEVRYEDMVADMPGQARQILDFLGLPWDDAVLEYHKRAREKHVHSPTYEAVTKPVYTSSVGRWRNYARQLEPHIDVLQPFIEAFGYA
jgi:tetratricopeptide (TPR) repeat protein